MNKKHISLKIAAKLANVSPSLIYHYIQKGLLPKPAHISNVGGGSLAVYPKGIVQNILTIKRKLRTKRSLIHAKEELSVKNKQKIIVDKIKYILNLASQKEYNEKNLKEELQNISGFIFSPSLASTCYTGEKLK